MGGIGVEAPMSRQVGLLPEGLALVCGRPSRSLKGQSAVVCKVEGQAQAQALLE